MYAVIRVRGEVHMAQKKRDALLKMMLTRVNHLVLLPENEYSKNQINFVRDFVTYGEINEKMLTKLLEKRGRLIGNKRLTTEFLAKNKIKSFEELAKIISSNPKKLRELGIKPVFRLRPPSKGYGRGGIKKQFKIGGALGYRGEKINELLERMI